MPDLPGLNTEWLLSRVELAETLALEKCGGSYPDAILILSSVISGIASHLWPGKDRIDYFRFVELWARRAAPSLAPNQVSILLLAQDLASRGDSKGSTAVRALSPVIDVPAGRMDDQTFTGSQVDRSEDVVLAGVPSLRRDQVRLHTYPSVFYRCFRSGYVHRYSDDPVVDQRPMSELKGDVIYTSFAEEPRRRVHFSVSWLGAIARSIILGADAIFQQRPLPRPKWWVKDA